MLLESVEETERLGSGIAAHIRVGDVIALSGDLGAGKTSLARGVLRGLGLEGEAPSPTFAIVQPYEDLRVPVWHVDLYRIESAAQLDQLGLDEARDMAAMLIEWPERLGDGLWPEALLLRLKREGEGARFLTAKVPPAWGTRWPPL